MQLSRLQALRFSCALALAASAPAAYAQPASWTVDPGAYEGTLTLTAALGEAAPEAGDYLAAFAASDLGEEVRGVAQAQALAGGTVWRFFLTAYGNTSGESLRFRFYDASAGSIRNLRETLAFQDNAIVGTVSEPLALSFGQPHDETLEPDDWAVNPAGFEASMSFVASVTLGEETTARGGVGDKLAAFSETEAGLVIRGVATPQTVGGASRFFLTVYGEVGETAPLAFRYYDAAEDVVVSLAETSAFQPDAVLGTTAAPFALSNGGSSLSDKSRWTVDVAAYESTMSVVGTLTLQGAPADASGADAGGLPCQADYCVAAFSGTEVRGVASAQTVGDEALFFLTVYGDASGAPLTFRAWDPDLGVLILDETGSFSANALVGSVDEPFVWNSPLGGGAARPSWTLDVGEFEQSMTLTISADFDGAPSGDDGDLVAAFVGDELRGVAQPSDVGGASRFFLTVYGRQPGEPVSFRAFDAAQKRLTESTSMVLFQPDANVGTASEPYSLELAQRRPAQVLLFPGDTNNDGVADQNDLLAISVQFGQVGEPRTENAGDIRWDARAAPTFRRWVATYADADGNGRVDQNDLLPLGLNFGRTRGAAFGTPRRGKHAGSTSFALEAPATAARGSVITARVSRVAGAPDATLGAGFRLAFDPEHFEVVAVRDGAGVASDVDLGRAVRMSRLVGPAANVEALAFSAARTDGGTVASGTFVEIDLRVRASARVGAASIALEDASGVATDGAAFAIGGQAASVSITGTVDSEPGGGAPSLGLGAPYPQPATARVSLDLATTLLTAATARVFDALGREVRHYDLAPGTQRLVLDASGLPSGVYIVRLEASSVSAPPPVQAFLVAR